MNLSRIALAAAITTTAASASAQLTHRLSFNDGTANDSVGAAHGTLQSGATVSGGSLMLSGGGAYASLPGATVGINTYTAATIELWLTSAPANTSFTMAAVLGRTYDPSTSEPNWSGYDYIMVQPTRGDGHSRVAITADNFSAERGVDGPGQINDSVEHYIAVTIGATDIAYYVDGALIGSAPLNGTTFADLSNASVYLGKSVYQFDPNFVGSINEFRIWNQARSASDIAAQFSAGANVVVPEPSAFALLGLGLASLVIQRRRN